VLPDRGVDSPAQRRPVPEDAVAAVFARAAELDAELSPGDAPAVLDVEALVEVGLAVGLSPEAVRRAVAEHQAGALVPTPPPPGTWVGPRAAVAERRVGGDARRVRRGIEHDLGRQWFRKVRGVDGRSLWVARDDLKARLARQVDFRHRLVLKGVSAVVLTTVDCGAGEVAVRLEADPAERRNGLGWMVAGLTTTGATVGLVAAAVAGFDAAALLVPATAAAGGGGGVALARRSYLDQLARLGDDLEGMIDRVARLG
jgi:hypothetical protein